MHRVNVNVPQSSKTLEVKVNPWGMKKFILKQIN